MDVVIVNYNTRTELQECLQSVIAQAPNEIIVIDNASDDSSVEMVRTEYPQVTVIANSVNQGYGAGANRGIAACKSEYVLVLNSDTQVHTGALAALAEYLNENLQVAVAGPRLLNPDGSLQPSCYPHPTPWFVLLEESTLARWIRYLPIARERYLRTWSHDHSASVPWVLGAALALRRSALDSVGGFDESFLLYWEEVDLCQRLRTGGWQIHFTPAATITHSGGASTAPRRGEMTRQLFNSAARFYRKHYAPWRLLILRLIIAWIMGLRMGRESVFYLYAALRNRQARLPKHSAPTLNFRADYRILTDALTGWQ